MNRIDWKSHGIELVVVFIGLSLAFALDNWRDTRKQADLEHKYLRSFQTELAHDRDDLDSLSVYVGRARDDVQRLAGMLRTGVEVHPDTVTALFAGSMTVSQLPQNRSTYASITSSGNLGVLRSYELRARLVSYYQLLEKSAIVTRVSNEFLDRYIVPLFIDHLDFVNQKWVPEGVVNEMRFRNVVIGYSQLSDQTAKAYEKISVERDTLAMLIDRTLAAR